MNDRTPANIRRTEELKDLCDEFPDRRWKVMLVHVDRLLAEQERRRKANGLPDYNDVDWEQLLDEYPHDSTRAGHLRAPQIPGTWTPSKPAA